MNAVREAVPQSNDVVVPPMPGQRPKARGCGQGKGSDPRRAIAERYPAGLISDDELEALLGLVKP